MILVKRNRHKVRKNVQIAKSVYDPKTRIQTQSIVQQPAFLIIILFQHALLGRHGFDFVQNMITFSSCIILCFIMAFSLHT